MQIFRKKCESCLHERTLSTGNLFGEKPQRDEAQRNRGVALNSHKKRRYTTSVNAFVRIEKYLLVRIAPLWFITIQQFFFDCNTLFEKIL